MEEEEEASIDNKGSGKGGEEGRGGRGIDFKDRVTTLRQLMIFIPFLFQVRK